MHHLMSLTIFLPMWGLQILLFGLRSCLMLKRSMEYQLYEDNGSVVDIVVQIYGTRKYYLSSKQF